MTVNGPNEWSDQRAWLVTRIAPVELAGFTEPDRARLTRSLTALTSALADGRTAGQIAGHTAGHTDGRTAGQTAGHTAGHTAGRTPGRTPGRTAGQTAGHADGAHIAATAVRAELDRGGSPRADDVLRTHLAIALAARTTEVRGITPDGALVVTDRGRLAECRALATEILALSPDPDLIAFATDLRHRLDRAERWRWVEPDVWTAATVGLAVLVLPFVGSAVGNAAVTAGGVLVGGALVFGFVVAHRKQQWAVDERSAIDAIDVRAAKSASRRPGL